MMEAHVFKHPLHFLSISLLLVGCAGQIRLDPLSADHPASPEAPEAPRPAPSETLREEPGDMPKTDSPQSGMRDQERSRRTMMHGQEGAERAKGMQHPGPDKEQQVGSEEVSAAAATVPKSLGTEKAYTCRMHPKVIRAKPGSCPECGMKPIEKEHLE